MKGQKIELLQRKSKKELSSVIVAVYNLISFLTY